VASRAQPNPRAQVPPARTPGATGGVARQPAASPAPAAAPAREPAAAGGFELEIERFGEE
jgi:hypothetical protein